MKTVHNQQSNLEYVPNTQTESQNQLLDKEYIIF